MAIPFYDPKVNSAPTADQVDGVGNTNTTPPSNMSNNLPDASTSEEDLMPWKLLALAMCNVLKNYYQQHLVANVDNSSTSSSAIIKILPSDHVKPTWQ